jgi:hypothetical protein
MPARSAILVLNHYADRHLFELLAEIEATCGDGNDVYLLSDRTRPGISFARPPPKTKELSFTRDDLVALAYPGKQDIALPGAEKRGLKLGNADLPVLMFYRQQPHYRYYWLVEYDVRFTGSWQTLFGAFESNDADLLGTSLVRYAECPNWSHWRSLVVPPDDVQHDDRIRGFFPVYRLSNDALACLHEAYQRGCGGHMETLVPTVLNRAGLRLEDIGGDGAFVSPHNVNRFYSNQRTSNELSPGTFVYRPARTEPGDQPDTLWHPVKPKEALPMRLANRMLREIAG